MKNGIVFRFHLHGLERYRLDCVSWHQSFRWKLKMIQPSFARLCLKTLKKSKQWRLTCCANLDSSRLFEMRAAQ